MRKWLALAVALVAGVAWSLVSQGGTATASPSQCTHNYIGAHFDSVTVPAGQECSLRDSTVNGTVRVGPDSVLYVCGTTISGSLDATQSYVNVDDESTISGSVDLNASGVSNVFGEGNCDSQGGLGDYSSVLCPIRIGGSVSVENTPWWADEVGIGVCGDGIDPIVGSVTINHNRTNVELVYNTIYGSLTCLDNNPTPEVNHNRINGSIHGQCFGGGGTSTEVAAPLNKH
jgi:hypothetical protein